MTSISAWAANEFGDAELGDERRTKRLVMLASQFASSPAGKVTEVVRIAAQREAAFRFVENHAIAPSAIAAAHHRATARRCRGNNEVVVAVDQACLSVTDRVGKPGFGHVTPKSGRIRGLQVMSALCVSKSGTVLGLVAQQWWSRLEKSPEYKTDARPAQERESDLWRRALLQANEQLRATAPHVTPFFQLDRGGDCRAVLQVVRNEGLKVTIRSAHDRALASGSRLHKTMLRAPVLGYIYVNVRRRPNRPGRVARLAVRARSVTLRLRDYRTRSDEAMQIQCVHVRETHAPRGTKPLEWWLLTTASVATFEEAANIAKTYTLRWKIEELHRAWKSGVCNIEDSQLRTAENFKRWATIAVAVAARSEHLKTRSRAEPDTSATTEFSRAEIDAAIILLEHKKYAVGDELTLVQVVDMIARIGGYIGKSSGGPPGVRTIQRGLDKIAPAAQAIEVLRNSG